MLWAMTDLINFPTLAQKIVLWVIMTHQRQPEQRGKLRVDTEAQRAGCFSVDLRAGEHPPRAGGWQVKEGVVCPVKEAGTHPERDKDPVTWP